MWLVSIANGEIAIPTSARLARNPCPRDPAGSEIAHSGVVVVLHAAAAIDTTAAMMAEPATLVIVTTPPVSRRDGRDGR